MFFGGKGPVFPLPPAWIRPCLSSLGLLNSICSVMPMYCMYCTKKQVIVHSYTLHANLDIIAVVSRQLMDAHGGSADRDKSMKFLCAFDGKSCLIAGL